MTHDARAIIRWVPFLRGGRKQPPLNSAGYCAPARFESDPEERLGAWSLRILEAAELRGVEILDCRVAFLVPEAPADLLRHGERFELLEGRKVVAKGVVLPPALERPAQISDFEVALLG